MQTWIPGAQQLTSASLIRLRSVASVQASSSSLVLLMSLELSRLASKLPSSALRAFWCRAEGSSRPPPSSLLLRLRTPICTAAKPGHARISWSAAREERWNGMSLRSERLPQHEHALVWHQARIPSQSPAGATDAPETALLCVSGIAAEAPLEDKCGT